MKTYILFWNPAVSSYKLENFQNEIEDTGYYGDMTWSIWEHKNASAGDRFFLVRCGDGNTGICMSGYFSSDPYQDEDWSGKERDTYYVNLEPDIMINPEYLPILTTAELVSAIPEFDWTGGHSGRLIDAHLAEKLEALWDNFLDEHSYIFDNHAVALEVDPSDYESKIDDKQTVELNFTDYGKVLALNTSCLIEIDGSDLEKVKKQVTKEIYKATGKKPEIIFKYSGVDEEYWPLYEKALKIVLANKKENDRFDWICWGFEEKVTYMFYKVGISSAEAKKQGFPEDVYNVLKLFERKNGEGLLQYVKRVAKNKFVRGIVRHEINEALNVIDRESVSVDDIPSLNENLAAYHYLASLDEKERLRRLKARRIQ